MRSKSTATTNQNDKTTQSVAPNKDEKQGFSSPKTCFLGKTTRFLVVNRGPRHLQLSPHVIIQSKDRVAGVLPKLSKLLLEPGEVGRSFPTKNFQQKAFLSSKRKNNR